MIVIENSNNSLSILLNTRQHQHFLTGIEQSIQEQDILKDTSRKFQWNLPSEIQKHIKLLQKLVTQKHQLKQ